MRSMGVRADRRAMVRGFLGLAAAGAALVAHPAAAYRGWCRSDPLVRIGGDFADIFAHAPPRILLDVSGPTAYRVTVPVGVETKLVLKGPGFGRGEKVTFGRSCNLKRTPAGIKVRVAMRVPARTKMPVRLEFAPRIVGLLNPESANGRTNEWVTLSTVF